ncbi:hypothetical protein LBMAG27_19200 [Bacteroidota bacterium]|nr:hypothetical protein LBMAG27_19200 [Bacteroidota bacterium]
MTLTFNSCSTITNNKTEQGNPIARVYEKYLYESDVEGVGKGAAKPEDSVLAVKNYIDAWIRHNLILHYAEENLSEKNTDLEKQLTDYRESLTVFYYEKELIKQKLDTVVDEQEITDYYKKYIDNFELKTAVSKMRYVMFPKSLKIKTDSATVWMKKQNEVNQSKLRNFCIDNAVKYQISDSSWFSIDELTSILPLEENNLDNAPYNKSYQTMSDSAYQYLVSFDDLKLKGNAAPMQYVRKDIINIILNKRKLAYLSTIHNSIYEDALQNKKFETY